MPTARNSRNEFSVIEVMDLPWQLQPIHLKKFWDAHGAL